MSFKIGDRVVCTNNEWWYGIAKVGDLGTIVYNEYTDDYEGRCVVWDNDKASKYTIDHYLISEEIYNSPLYKLLQEEK